MIKQITSGPMSKINNSPKACFTRSTRFANYEHPLVVKFELRIYLIFGCRKYFCITKSIKIEYMIYKISCLFKIKYIVYFKKLLLIYFSGLRAPW